MNTDFLLNLADFASSLDQSGQQSKADLIDPFIKQAESKEKELRVIQEVYKQFITNELTEESVNAKFQALFNDVQLANIFTEFCLWGKQQSIPKSQSDEIGSIENWNEITPKQQYSQVLTSLIKIANHLDKLDKQAESNTLDEVIQRLAERTGLITQ